MLIELLQIGGVTALTVGVLYLLYKQFLSMGIFPELTQRQAFTLLLVVIVFIFFVVVLGFASTGRLSFTSPETVNTNNINSGDSSQNTVIQGD